MKKQPKRLKARGQAGAFGVASIPLIGFFLFAAIPLAVSIVVAFSELNSYELSEMKFIGFDNFKSILFNEDKTTYSSYFTTFVFALNAPICIAISLWIAFLINKSKIGKTFFRSVFFIPYVCSSVVITLTFKNLLFRPEGGVINSIFEMIGYQPVNWINETPELFMMTALFMSVWSGLGWCIVLFQAALANVDQSYYEAARLDGASTAQMFWKITWPAISPTTSFILTMKLIGAFQAMEELMLLVPTGSFGPSWSFGQNAWASDTVTKQIYNMMGNLQYGRGAAAGWILAIVILIVTRINLRTQKRWVNYDF